MDIIYIYMSVTVGIPCRIVVAAGIHMQGRCTPSQSGVFRPCHVRILSFSPAYNCLERCPFAVIPRIALFLLFSFYLNVRLFVSFFRTLFVRRLADGFCASDIVLTPSGICAFDRMNGEADSATGSNGFLDTLLQKMLTAIVVDCDSA